MFREVKCQFSRPGCIRLEENKAGLAPNQAEGFFNHLFRGINSQLYNALPGLFIEQRLYERFPALRPIQFLSLRRL